jgi:hypothetical protein
MAYYNIDKTGYVKFNKDIYDWKAIEDKLNKYNGALQPEEKPKVKTVNESMRFRLNIDYPFIGKPYYKEKDIMMRYRSVHNRYKIIGFLGIFYLVGKLSS